MRYGQLIRTKAQDDSGEVNVTRLAELTKLRGFSKPSYTRWYHNLHEQDGPKEMPWGTTSYMRSAIDFESVMGAAAALDASPRDVWLSVGESGGLPGMFPSNNIDTAIVRLPRGWWDLSRDRFSTWADAGRRLVEEQETIAAKDAEIAELRARVAELEESAAAGRATRPTTRRPPRN